MASERPEAVTIQGKPFTLVGNEIRPGSRAPDFTVLSTDLQPITLASLEGKTRILLSVTSLDTSVCDMEAKTFSERAGELENCEILLVSVDLPPAQKRWCGAEGVDNITCGSDHRDLSFGQAYGVLIRELRLLARAAFVVNPAGEVAYAEYVPEVADQPDYDAVIEAARQAAAAPA